MCFKYKGCLFMKYQLKVIFKNQALTEKILTGKIANKQDLCNECNCTLDEAENLFSEISSICTRLGIDPSSLDERDLDKVSGGFGLSKDQKNRAVIASLLAITSFSGSMIGNRSHAVTAESGLRVGQKVSLAAGINETSQSGKEEIFDEITKKAESIAQIKPYTSLHIYTKQDRESARNTVESLQKLAKDVTERYDRYSTSGRAQLAAQNLEATVLNCQAT